MINNVKKGDVVVTSGGIVGKVEKLLDEDLLQIKIAENVAIKVVKSTLSNVTNKKFSTATEAKETKKAKPVKKTATKKAPK